MIRLALETASAWLGTAVLDGERVLAEFHQHRPLEQSAALAPAVREVLRGAGLDLADVREVAVSCGPGSFTGLRVGAAFARALADARGLAVVPVPTALALVIGAEAGPSSGPGSDQGSGPGGIPPPAQNDIRPRGNAAMAGAFDAAAGGLRSGTVILHAAGGTAFCQPFEVRGGVPAARGELERVEYAELAARLGGAGPPGEDGVWACDPAAAERLAATAPGAAARLVCVEPRGAWVGVYAQRAGRAVPAREFLPLYGHSPIFRKRVRAT